MEKVRVRFAPSPTGMLHPGGARTALFNHLFARYHGGESVLRIEDTDRARSERRFEENLLEDLDWLGLRFDGGPIRQSERGSVYEGFLERLDEAGLLYESADEAGRRALYFRPPERSGRFCDALRGEVPFAKVQDFVVRKSDGSPSYNFAAVSDDLQMGITHILRGEEHLSNTARQTLLYRALDEPEPRFIHLGVILGPDGSKLSKRHGAASVAAYRAEGYLPEALVNHLALLGWSHPEGREFFADLEDLERDWEPSRLGASPATFDAGRLLALNAEHIRALPPENLLDRLAPFLEGPLPPGRETVAAKMLQEDLRVLSEAPELLAAVTGPVDPATFAAGLPASSAEVFEEVERRLEGRELTDLEEAEAFVKELRGWAKEQGIKTRDLLHPLRLALTGRGSGPEMAYLFAVQGPREAECRIGSARRAILRG